MSRYLGLRLSATILSLLGVTLVLFSLLRFLPGDPAYTILLSMVEPGSDASQITQRDVEALQEQLGLRDPYPVQYVHWLESVVTGNLGTSFRSRQPVTRGARQPPARHSGACGGSARRHDRDRRADRGCSGRWRTAARSII